MVDQRPFRFGVLAEGIETGEVLHQTAHRAEALGYSTFLIRDHFLREPFGYQLAPLTTLATVAAITERLRVGTLVIANDVRPPVQLAQEAATLDYLSGGRLELGLGTGFLEAEYRRLGIPFDRPADQIERFGESLQILKRYFAGEPFEFAGKRYQIEQMAGFPRPLQRPHPPLLVGAGGRRMLSIAAREADIIGLLTVSTANGVLATDPAPRMAAAVERQIGWIRKAAGARFDRIELSQVASAVITEDRCGAAREYVERSGWHEVAVEDVLEMPGLFIGSIDEIIEQLLVRRARFGISYYVVRAASLEVWAPIVDQLASR